jgi:dihydroorotate dehydrogenase (NAD+) catalytic subunit
MATLSVNFFGKTLNNPVMNASGTLGYGYEIEPLWPVKTMGAYVTKGLSLEPHHGNPTPRVWEERGGMINSIGLQNVGVKGFFERYFPFFEKREVSIIVNFFGFTEEEYILCAKAIKPHPLIIALEMNLSCPNIKKGGISFGKEPSMVRSIIEAVKEVTDIPLLAKLTPEVSNIVDVAKAACEAGADGLTLLNTMPAAVVDTKARCFPIRGGLSGPVLRPVALRAVCDCARAVPLPIIGAGGIMDATDAVAFLMAGARGVQVGTASFVEPYAIPRIVEGLAKYLDGCGYPGVEDIVGLALGEEK